jgi:hypothetical protein
MNILKLNLIIFSILALLIIETLNNNDANSTQEYTHEVHKESSL